MRVAEALSRAHPKGRRQSVVPEGVRVMLLCGLANPIPRNLDWLPRGQEPIALDRLFHPWPWSPDHDLLLWKFWPPERHNQTACAYERPSEHDRQFRERSEGDQINY